MKSIKYSNMLAVMALLGCHSNVSHSVFASQQSDLSKESDNMADSEQIQTFAEAGLRFVIPCKTKLCESYLQKLNPSNDWVPFNNDSMDQEDSDDKAPSGHKAYPHGSKYYGHVQTRDSAYHTSLSDMHLRDEIRQNEQIKKHEHHMMHKLHKQLPKEIKRLHQDDERREKQEHDAAKREYERRNESKRKELEEREKQKADKQMQEREQTVDGAAKRIVEEGSSEKENEEQKEVDEEGVKKDNETFQKRGHKKMNKKAKSAADDAETTMKTLHQKKNKQRKQHHKKHRHHHKKHHSFEDDEEQELLNSNSLNVAGLDAVQLDETVATDKKPWGTFMVLQNQTVNHSQSMTQPQLTLAQSTLLSGQKPKKSHQSLIQNGIEKFGITTDFLQRNINFFDIKGKMLQDSKFRSAFNNVPTVDNMLDENQGPNMFEKEITSHFGGLY